MRIIFRDSGLINMDYAGFTARLRASAGNFIKKNKPGYFLSLSIAVFMFVSMVLSSYYYVLPAYYGLSGKRHGIKMLKNKIRAVHEKKRILRIITSFRPGLPLAEERKVAGLIFNTGEKYAISPALILAVIRVESSFNNFSYSDMGAVGLMQVKPVTGLYLIKKYKIKSKKFNYNTRYIEYLPVSYLYNPSLNIRLGARYLLSLLYEFKNLKLALFAYNAGPAVIFKTMDSNRLNPKEEGGVLSKLETTNPLFSDFYYGYYKRVKKYFRDYNKIIFKHGGRLEFSWKHKYFNYNPPLVEK